MKHDPPSLQTRAVHSGDPRPRIGGALITPIFQSAVFEHRSETSDYSEVTYPRLSNLPNHVALAQKLADLEGTEAAVGLASGAAAISSSLIAVLGPGGHTLVQSQLYGGTHMLVTEYFDKLGFEYDFIDPEDADSWASKLKPNTRAIYVEAISNPLMQVIDHERVIAFAREHSLTSLIDATFATPVNFRPAEIGFDLVLHSATKYLNGHSDLAAGAVAGSEEWIDKIRRWNNELGAALTPIACFLLSRGLKTLPLRVGEQNRNALALARALVERDEVARVNYPGLEQHPQHARARKLFDGFGGMLSIDLAGGLEAARRFENRLTIPLIGPSLGGLETLVTRPATTSHVGMTPQERAALGIGDGLLRVSVGIESADDLIADFLQAL